MLPLNCNSTATYLGSSSADIKQMNLSLDSEMLANKTHVEQYWGLLNQFYK